MSDKEKNDTKLKKLAVSERVLEEEGFIIETGEEIEITIMPKDTGVSE